jgi:hypothetical protein
MFHESLSPDHETGNPLVVDAACGAELSLRPVGPTPRRAERSKLELDGRATGQPQGFGSEAYLNATSQGELVLNLSKEHPRTHGRTAISVVVVSIS